MYWKLIQRTCIALIFSVGLVFTWAALAWSAESRGVVFRNFLAEIVTASTLDEKQQAKELRHAFTRYPQVLEWIVEERDFQKLFYEADLSGMAPKVMGEVEIAEKIQSKAHEAVNFWIQDPQFKKIAEDIVNQKLPAIVNNKMLQEEVRDAARVSLVHFEKLPPKERLRLLATIDDAAYRDIAEHVRQSVAETRISDSEAVKLLTKSEVFVLDGLPITSDELSQYIGKYFDALPLGNRQKMFLAYLKLPPGASLEDKLGAVLPNTGPGFKKMLQQFAGKTKSDILNKIAKKLQADNPTGDEALKVLDEALTPREKALIEWIDPKPLQSGTIGQVHVGKLKNGKEFVVKIRHEGIIKEVEEEMNATRIVAQGTPFEELTDQARESLTRETNFVLEAGNQDLAESYNNPKKGIKVPARLKEFDLRENILFQEKAEGQLMNKMEGMLVQRGRLLNDFLGEWFDRAMFKDGFFHSDPHPGNIIIAEIKQEHPDIWTRFLTAIGKGPPELLNQPIDYGNSGKLTLPQRRSFMQMAIGAAVGSPEQMVHGLGGLDELTPEVRDEILLAVREVNWEKMSLSARIQPMLTHAIKKRFFVPTDLLNFNRGKMLLEDEIVRINRALDAMDPERKLARYHPQITYAKVMTRRLGLDVPKQFFSKMTREKSIAPIDQLFAAFVRGAAPKVDALFFGWVGCARRELAKHIH